MGGDFPDVEEEMTYVLDLMKYEEKTPTLVSFVVSMEVPGQMRSSRKKIRGKD
jgi:hypothetical protein